LNRDVHRNCFLMALRGAERGTLATDRRMTTMINIDVPETTNAKPHLNRVSPSYNDNQVCATEGIDIARDLSLKEDELQRCKSDLKKIKKEFLRTNRALSTLARNLSKEQNELVQKITVNIAHRVLPAIDEIEHCKTREMLRCQLDIVQILMRNFWADDTDESNPIIVLSTQEFRVATMISKGLKTSDIARLLYLSDVTVKTHRRAIRKKLGISQGANLSSALKLKLGNPDNLASLDSCHQSHHRSPSGFAV
jgi:ATP/maltotriose-dependent transcriptional regulator MalT